MTGNQRTGRRASDGWWWRAWGLLPWAVGLGVVTSVAVAWGCGAVQPLLDLLDRQEQVQLVDHDRANGSRINYISWPLRIARTNAFGVTAWYLSSEGDQAVLTQAMEDFPVFGRWRGEVLAEAQTMTGFHDVRVFHQGLPLRCVEGADFPESWPNPESKSLFRVGQVDERVLCYRPLWLGLAVNTAFWGALWLGVLSVPTALRGRRRRTRGLCPECGYDLKGELAGGCPECGWGRDSSSLLGEG